MRSIIMNIRDISKCAIGGYWGGWYGFARLVISTFMLAGVIIAAYTIASVICDVDVNDSPIFIGATFGGSYIAWVWAQYSNLSRNKRNA